MRKLFTQKEVIKVALLLGIKSFTRGNIWYWEKARVFSKPYSAIAGGVAWYKRQDVILSLMNVQSRLVASKKFKQEDMSSWEDIQRILDIVASEGSQVTKQLKQLKKQL